MDEETLNEFESAIEDLPEEVSDFLFGEEMQLVKEDIAKLIGNPEVSAAFENTLMFFLLGESPQEELDQALNTLPLDDTKKTALRSLIQEKVFDALLLLVEVHTEIDKEAGKPTTETPSAPSPADVLDRLKERLVETKVVAPITREHVPDSEKGILKETDTIAPPKEIDPYREMPL